MCNFFVNPDASIVWKKDVPPLIHAGWYEILLHGLVLKILPRGKEGNDQRKQGSCKCDEKYQVYAICHGNADRILNNRLGSERIE